MKIVLLGYGKMGKEVEAIALSRGHEIIARIDASISILDESILKSGDVAIEFSQPNAAPQNIAFCLKLGLPIVVGTTGWYDRLAEVKALVEENEGKVMAATNFSIGVQLFLLLNEWFASKMNTFTNYEVQVEETHHVHKKDAPSGTAISILEKILEQIDSKIGWELNTTDSRKINVLAHRIDEVPGTHEISYRSEVDEIRLIHTAYNRKGFAEGAVKAAEWLITQEKGFYGMNDFLGV